MSNHKHKSNILQKRIETFFGASTSKASTSHSMEIESNSQIDVDLDETIRIDDVTIVKENTQKLVQYFLENAHTKLPIKRANIIKHVLGGIEKREYEATFKECSRILEKQFGLKVELVTVDGKVNEYMVLNLLSKVDIPNESMVPPNSEEQSVNREKVLQLLILAHVLMSEGSCTQEELYDFLSEVGNAASNLKFVNVHYVIQNMIEQHYLELHTAMGSNSVLNWGQRAKLEISQEDVMKFVSNIMET